MPRKLPWLVDAAKSKERKKAQNPSSPAPKRRRDSSPGDLVDLDLNPVVAETPPSREKKQAARTPSTSPPPAPPAVEYMREGYNADDIYMMVEDEFLSTAKTFTQHLHHAEYVRFKKLAKSRGANVLEAIQRPVDGKTEQSRSLKLQMEAEQNAKRIKLVLNGDESSGDEDEYMQDPQLAGLMGGVKGGRHDLSGLNKTASNTRAAAGFAQSPRNVERMKDVPVLSKEVNPMATPSKIREIFAREADSDTEDDLDAVPSTSRLKSYAGTEKKQGMSNEVSRRRDEAEDRVELETSNPFKAYARASRVNSPRQSHDTNDDSLSFKQRDQKPFSTSSKPESANIEAKSTAASDYLAKRRAEREKKAQDEKRKTKAAIDVPTFAI